MKPEEKNIVKPKRLSAFVVLIFFLLLPSLCLLPARSELKVYSEEHQGEVLADKILWEKRFNNGVMVVFPTVMLWILAAAPIALARKGKIRELAAHTENGRYD